MGEDRNIYIRLHIQ